jgi:SDR family mycofactocin-dependent oxidoreductase
VTRLAGKVALITGAARGQGRSHALRLAREGADVIALDVGADVGMAGTTQAVSGELAETGAAVEAIGRRAYTATVDVRDRDGIESAVTAALETFGSGLDIVVANAGICTVQHWFEVTPELWQTTLDVNLTGAWNTCSVAAPHLIERGGGSIVLVSSSAGLKGMAFLVPYAASKHGLVGLMRALSNELAEHQVRVNTIHPGAVATPMSAGMGRIVELREDSPHLAATFQNTMGVKAIDPSDISDAVVYLVSDESKFVTGITLPIDAGTTAI